MALSATRVRRSCWLVLAAMFALALAPTVSHALAFARGASWQEICTAQGARRVPAGDDAPVPAPAPLPTSPFDHCGYCVGSSGVGPLPAAWAGLPAVPGGCGDSAAGPSEAPRIDLAWPDARPRGPPEAVAGR
jgi:hypothetical protein